MKFCSNCGTQIADEMNNCPNCGQPVAAAPAQAAPMQQVPMGQPGYMAQNPAPAYKLKTNKGLLKTILLSLITFGIYGLVVMTSVSNDINTIATKYDGKKTMHYCLLFFLIIPITLGIGGIVWSHKISNRIGKELTRRNINYKFSAGTYWGWGVLGTLIIVGPFIYMHKLFKSMNLLAENYNING